MQLFPDDMSDSDYFKMAELKRSQQNELKDLVDKLKKKDKRDREEKQRKTLWGKIKLFFGF
tara:strand:- start:475 stop:657 length:183 start_codon:yes stop_codon:yes gene_type:complete